MTQSYAQIRGEAAANAWEAEAIKKTMADPTFPKDMCPICVMHHPCICDKNHAIAEMREFYEANREKRLGERFLPVTRTEPVLELNWGRKGDGLMDGLWQIAKKYALGKGDRE